MTAAKNLETFSAAELDTMIAAKYLEIETLEDAILQSPESAVEARQLLMTKIDNLDLEIIDFKFLISSIFIFLFSSALMKRISWFMLFKS